MQGIEEQEPTVRIRSLKKDRVNFVLENVNLAYVHSKALCNRRSQSYIRFANSLRRVVMADIPTVGGYALGYFRIDLQ